MPELVEVPDDVERADFSIANLESGGLQRCASDDTDEARKAIDGHDAKQLWTICRLDRQPIEEAEDAIYSAYDVAEGKDFAPTV